MKEIKVPIVGEDEIFLCPQDITVDEAEELIRKKSIDNILSSCILIYCILGMELWVGVLMISNYCL
jgi:hypothetical protein